MSLFKKISSTPTSANIQATVLPVASGLDPRAETQTYMVSIESNNADLINENVNSIELSSETKPVNVATSALAPNISGGELTNIVKASNTHSSSPKARSVGSIDPKMTVSHGDLGLSNSKPISDNIIRENIIFSERRMSEVPAHSITAAEVAKGNIHFNNANVSFTALRDTTLSGVLSPGDTFKSSGHFSPIVKKRTSATIPKKTTTISKIKVRKNEQIKVNLRSASGKLIGRAGNSAKNIQPNLETQDQQTLLKPFRLLSSNPEPFKINTSQNEDGFHLHVVSRFPSMFHTFEVQARYVSDCAALDRYTSLGDFNIRSGKNILLNTSGNLSMIFHIIPKYKGKNLCWSQTYTHAGLETQNASLINSFQSNLDGNSSGILAFRIYRYPASGRKLYAVRTNVNSGQQVRFSTVDLPIGERVDTITDDYIDWADSTIGMKNSIYSYDFFTIDKWGFESHVGNHTTRTFEKDLSGIRFTNIQAGTKDASFHQIKFQLHIPDLWIPRPEDDLMNPGDSIYEAAREKKKIGLVQLVRHSSTRLPHIVDTFIINPGNAINEIPTELLDNGEVLGTIQIDKPFSQKYGLSDVYGDTEYIYELRAGWYYLSNELSFLKNPLKLTVPNEFTGGKVGYSFHPYIYESPLSKDFSIIPKLGEDKHFLKVEALVDVCALAVYPKKNSFKKIPTLRCSLGSNRFGNNKILPYATITATIQKSTVEVLDHVEILVANSSDGSWLTLGKHKLTSGNFVFIDDVGPALSTNKIKYCIIGRNLSFDTVFKVAGNVISLQKYNFIERDDVSANSISVNPLTNNKLR